MKLSRLVLLALLLIVGWSSAARAEIGTSFSLQGRLADDDVLAVGPVDLRITPWDAATAGATLEAPVELTGVALEQGVFSVDVDFGPMPFLGEPVWLAVEVRGPGEADYTLLEPRQRVAPTPYALHARSVAVDSVDGFAIQDGAVGASAIDPSQVQRRIGPDCAAGEALAGVAEDGTSSCVPTGEGDWYLWPDGSAVTARKKVSVGTDGTRGAQFLVFGNSGISTPQIELFETENDYARLSLANAGDGHFGFWTLAARTYPADDGGPAADRINFFNNRTGDAMVLLGDGRLGIGVFTPTEALDVDGGLRLRSLQDGAAGPARPLVVTADGRVAADGATRRHMAGYSEFRPRVSSVTTIVFEHSVIVSTPGTNDALYASARLPQGARITGLSSWLTDQVADREIVIYLLRIELAGTTSQLVARVISSDSTTGVRAFTGEVVAGREIVDNSQYLYQLQAFPAEVTYPPGGGITTSVREWVGSDTAVRAVAIDYLP